MKTIQMKMNGKMKQLLQDQVLNWVKKQTEEVTVIDVVKALGLTYNSVGKILWTLELQGKVDVRKTGKRNYYKTP